MVEQHHMRQFLLFIFALLIPCFALWTVASAVLAMPVVGLVNMILVSWFPTVVDGLFMQGADALLMTEFGELNGRMVPPDQSDYQLGFRVNHRLVSYCIPFYAALHFATQKEEYLGGFVTGLLTLFPFMLLGLLCMCLKELMVNLGSVFFEQPGVFVPGANVISILYQFNVLIVPSVAPILLWVWQSRDTALLQGVFKMTGAGGESEN